MILREGLHVVLAGQPNVGKSSLLNALAGEELAIVTDIAGTTRDKVSQVLHLKGVPITIVDTAGLRQTNDQLESIGIARSWDEIARADVVIHLKDINNLDTQLDDEITQHRPAKSIVLTVFNKADLLSTVPTSSVEHLYVSAKTGLGLDFLTSRLLEIAGWQPSQESPWLARHRHIDALETSLMHLREAEMHASQNDRVLDLFAEELRLAHEELGSITGQMTPDDLLGEIFSRFCIGK
jgi:tRNA modification GTPase